MSEPTKEIPDDVKKLARECMIELMDFPKRRPHSAAATLAEIRSGNFDEMPMMQMGMFAILSDRAARATDKAIDELAYRFWSVHPKELDEWVRTDNHPAMPQGYKGGVRAWFFAFEMRKLLGGSN